MLNFGLIIHLTALVGFKASFEACELSQKALKQVDLPPSQNERKIIRVFKELVIWYKTITTVQAIGLEKMPSSEKMLDMRFDPWSVCTGACAHCIPVTPSARLHLERTHEYSM